MHQQFYCNKKNSNINDARLFGQFKIIATCDTSTRCNVQYHIVMTILNLIIRHQIVDDVPTFLNPVFLDAKTMTAY